MSKTFPTGADDGSPPRDPPFTDEWGQRDRTYTHSSGTDLRHLFLSFGWIGPEHRRNLQALQRNPE